MDRRSFLGGSGVLALVGVAGCICGYSATAAEDRTPTDTPEGTPTDTVTTPGAATETPTAATTEGTTDPGTTDAGGTTGETTTTARETPTATPTETPTPTETAARSSVTVTVGGDLARFDPQEFELAQGGTVEWVWEGNDHNVVPSDQPASADWTGTPGPDSETYDEGYTYSYTFEVRGEYEYHCYTHDQYGMVGSFTVV